MFQHLLVMQLQYYLNHNILILDYLGIDIDNLVIKPHPNSDIQIEITHYLGNVHVVSPNVPIELIGSVPDLIIEKMIKTGSSGQIANNITYDFGRDYFIKYPILYLVDICGLLFKDVGFYSNDIFIQNLLEMKYDFKESLIEIVREDELYNEFTIISMGDGRDIETINNYAIVENRGGSIHNCLIIHSMITIPPTTIHYPLSQIAVEIKLL